jgi:hypothetical protein
MEKDERGALMKSCATVTKGKVTWATPALKWAEGEGLHVLLSWAVRHGKSWKKKASKGPIGQLELAL